jgi:streptomycin 6-kinase
MHAGCSGGGNKTATVPPTAPLSSSLTIKNASIDVSALSDTQHFPSFATKREYIQYYEEYISNRTSKYFSIPKDERILNSSVCPATDRFVLNGHEHVLNLSLPIVEGRGTKLFQTNDEKFVIKMVHRQSDFVLDMLWRDDAALRIMADTGISPRVFTNDTLAAPICDLRTLTMEKSGFQTLHALFKDRGPLDLDLVVSIGRRAIRMVETIHSRGLIHGDIHWGNFVYQDINDIPGTLKLLDYGRSMPYIDSATGEHLPRSALRANGTVEFDWNPVLLSIHELNGEPIGRRDDTFRLAEMLLNLYEGTLALTNREKVPFRNSPDDPTEWKWADLVPASPHRVMKKKRFRNFKETTPDEWRHLYVGSMRMEFDDEPDYDILDPGHVAADIPTRLPPAGKIQNTLPLV